MTHRQFAAAMGTVLRIDDVEALAVVLGCTVRRRCWRITIHDLATNDVCSGIRSSRSPASASRTSTTEP